MEIDIFIFPPPKHKTHKQLSEKKINTHIRVYTNVHHNNPFFIYLQLNRITDFDSYCVSAYVCVHVFFHVLSDFKYFTMFPVADCIRPLTSTYFIVLIYALDKANAIDRESKL